MILEFMVALIIAVPIVVLPALLLQQSKRIIASRAKKPERVIRKTGWGHAVSK